MNINQCITETYSIRLKDFYKNFCFLFEIHCDMSWWYFEIDDVNEFNEEKFLKNLYVSGYFGDIEKCDCYEKMLEDIKNFYPLNEYIKIIGL